MIFFIILKTSAKTRLGSLENRALQKSRVEMREARDRALTHPSVSNFAISFSSVEMREARDRALTPSLLLMQTQQ